MLTRMLLPLPVRGRWGITSADCDDMVDDNKRVMLVEPGSLRFVGGSAAVHVLDAVGPDQWRADFLVVVGRARR